MKSEKIVLNDLKIKKFDGSPKHFRERFEYKHGPHFFLETDVFAGFYNYDYEGYGVEIKKGEPQYHQFAFCMKYVYFIENESIPGYVKIGKTSQPPSSRLKSFNTAAPKDYTFKKIYLCLGPTYERTLHDFFKKYHFKKEWFHQFDIDDELMALLWLVEVDEDGNVPLENLLFFYHCNAQRKTVEARWMKTIMQKCLPKYYTACKQYTDKINAA